MSLSSLTQHRFEHTFCVHLLCGFPARHMVCQGACWEEDEASRFRRSWPQPWIVQCWKIFDRRACKTPTHLSCQKKYVLSPLLSPLSSSSPFSLPPPPPSLFITLKSILHVNINFVWTDFKMRILLVGEAGSGKSSIASLLINESIDSGLNPHGIVSDEESGTRSAMVLWLWIVVRVLRIN